MHDALRATSVYTYDASVLRRSQTVFTGMRQNKVDRRRKLVNHSVGGCIEAKAVRLREGDNQVTNLGTTCCSQFDFNT